MHLHQPDLRPAGGGRSLLPWVRLHAVRGYLDLAEALAGCNHLHWAASFSGILIEQLAQHSRLYEQGDIAPDVWAELCLLAPSRWTTEQREFAVANFFTADLESMIRPLPRYSYLYDRRKARLKGREPGDPAALRAAAASFSDDELRDLCVCFNLAWLGATARKNKSVQRLLKKGGGYSARELRFVLTLQGRLLREILPRFRKLAELGRCELGFSPQYQPVLPLIGDLRAHCDRKTAAQLPEFRHPEHVLEQIRLGKMAFQQAFGRPPSGCWPAGGMLCEESLRMLASAGMDWCLADQSCLPAQVRSPLSHVRPWFAERNDWPVTVFFRDCRLSEHLAHGYNGQDPAEAAADFVRRALQLGRDSAFKIPVVSLALPAETAFQGCRGGGAGMLQELELAFAAQPDLELWQPFELSTWEQWPDLRKVRPGSADGVSALAEWTTGPLAGSCWQRLAETCLVCAPHLIQDAVRRHLMAAEASDWLAPGASDADGQQRAVYEQLFSGHLEAAIKACPK